MTFDAFAPPFLYRNDGELTQPMLFRAPRDVDSGEVRIGTSRFPIKSQAAGGLLRLPLPSDTAGRKVTVELLVAGVVETQVVDVPLARSLTLHVFHHAHQDAGWADRPSQMRDRMTDYLDAALAEIERTRAHPAGARFRWNVESAFLIEDWLATAGSERRQALVSAARSGFIEIGALYTGLHTDLASLEELCQVAAYAHRLRETLGVPIRSAFLNDVPGLAWSLPTVLAGSGVDQLVWGPDPIRALTHKSGRPPLYRYVGSGGGSLLTWQSPYAYIEAWPLARAAPDEWDELIDGLVRRYLKDDCPSAHALLHTAHDFNPPSSTIADAIAAWNERWTSPMITMSTASEFFNAVRLEGCAFPSYSGPSPDPWTDGAGSLAAATGRKRRAERRLVDAVQFAALTQRLDVRGDAWQARIEALFPPTAMQLAKRPWFDYPTRDIEEAYASLLLVDEHTFGSVEASRPNRGLGRAHWLEKERHYDDLARHAEVLALEGAERIAREAATPGERSVVVLNPTSRTRSGTIEIAVPSDWGPVALDEAPTELVALRHDTSVLRAYVDAIPPHGYRRFGLSAAEHRPGPQVEEGAARIESAAFALELDAEGVASSLLDRARAHELVDRSGPHRLGQLVLLEREDVPIEIADDFDDSMLTGQQVWDVAADLGRFMRELSRVTPVLRRTWRRETELSALLVAEHELPGYGSLVTEYRLAQREPVLELVLTLDKRASLPREAAYVCFPFALTDPAAIVDGPGYTYAPGEQLGGSAHDHLPVHDWIACAGREAVIVLAPVEAPLIDIGGLHNDRWLREPEGPQSHLASYVFNHSWWTNFPLTQFGQLVFSYRLTTLPRDASIADIAAAGNALAHDLDAVAIDPERAYGTQPEVCSFVRVEPGEVQITGMRAIPVAGAADLLIRVLERSGTARTAQLSLADGRGTLVTATKTGIFGDGGQSLMLRDGIVHVPLDPGELATVRVSFR